MSLSTLHQNTFAAKAFAALTLHGGGVVVEVPLFDYLRGAPDERAYAARHDVSDRPFRPIPEIPPEVPVEVPGDEELVELADAAQDTTGSAPQHETPTYTVGDRMAALEAIRRAREGADLVLEKARQVARERAQRRQRELEIIALAALADDEE